MLKTVILALFVILSPLSHAEMKSKKACRSGNQVSCESFKSAKRKYFCTKNDPSKLSIEKKQSRCEKPKKRTAKKVKRKMKNTKS